MFGSKKPLAESVSGDELMDHFWKNPPRDMRVYDDPQSFDAEPGVDTSSGVTDLSCLDAPAVDLHARLSDPASDLSDLSPAPLEEGVTVESRIRNLGDQITNLVQHPRP